VQEHPRVRRHRPRHVEHEDDRALLLAGRVPAAVHPTNSPEPNAPSSPPPEMARNRAGGRGASGANPSTCLCLSTARSPSAMSSSRCFNGKKRALAMPEGSALAVSAAGTDGKRSSDAHPAATRTQNATRWAVSRRQEEGRALCKRTVIRRLTISLLLCRMMSGPAVILEMAAE